jgi:hypothetical protein
MREFLIKDRGFPLSKKNVMVFVKQWNNILHHMQIRKTTS